MPSTSNHPRSQPKFPVEILCQIVDAMSSLEDASLSSSISLTCHAFRIHCYKHRFATVCIDKQSDEEQKRRLAQFADILNPTVSLLSEHNPSSFQTEVVQMIGVAPFVRTFCLCSAEFAFVLQTDLMVPIINNVFRLDRGQEATANGSTTPLVSHRPERRLVIGPESRTKAPLGIAQWDQLSESFKQAFRDILRSPDSLLTSLKLCYMHEVPLDLFQDVRAESSETGTLKLKHLDLFEFSFDYRWYLKGPSPYEFVDPEIPPSVAASKTVERPLLLESLRYVENLPATGLLRWMGYNVPRHSNISDFKPLLEACLSKLTVLSVRLYHDRVTETVFPIIHAAKKLKSLELCCRIDGGCPASSWTLDYAHLPHLSTISLSMTSCSDDRNSSDWIKKWSDLTIALLGGTKSESILHLTGNASDYLPQLSTIEILFAFGPQVWRQYGLEGIRSLFSEILSWMQFRGNLSITSAHLEEVHISICVLVYSLTAIESDPYTKPEVDLDGMRKYLNDALSDVRDGLDFRLVIDVEAGNYFEVIFGTTLPRYEKY